MRRTWIAAGAVLSTIACGASSAAAAEPGSSAAQATKKQPEDGAAAPKPKPPPAAPSLALALGPDFLLTPSAQYLLRFRHHEGHDFVAGGSSNTLRHRARLGLQGMYRGRVGVFAQVQDVRTLGEETDTLNDFSADGFDLHQAYARILPLEQLELRLGRQEIAHANHRLIGTVGWVEQARSFDAVRVLFQHEELLKLDAFYAKVGEDAAGKTNAAGEPVFADDVDLIAGTLQLTPLKELGVSVSVIDNINLNGLRTITWGGMAFGQTDFGLSYSAEGYHQYGTGQPDRTHEAALAAARVRLTIDVPTKPFIEVHTDVLTGDGDPADAKSRTFDTLYATNHKFYGEMDFFLNLPVHTGGRGLADAGGTVGFVPLEPLLMAQIAYHHFHATVERPDGRRAFGDEVNIKAVCQPLPYLSLDLLYGVFVPGDIMAAKTGEADASAEHFVFSTVDASF